MLCSFSHFYKNYLSFKADYKVSKYMHQSLNQIKSIVIIGSGNVATNLGLTLFNKGYLC